MLIMVVGLMHHEKVKLGKELRCDKHELNALIVRARVLLTKKRSPAPKYSVVLSGQRLHLSMKQHFALRVMCR